MIRMSITVATLSLGLAAGGQDRSPAAALDGALSRARLVAHGDTIEITDDAARRRSVLAPLAEGDSVRTGLASFAVIAVDPGIELTLGPDSVVGLESLGAVPVIRLEAGKVRVGTDSWALRVRTSFGDFLLSEGPGEADLELSEGKVILGLRSGGLTMENVDSEAVVFRAPGEPEVRTYRVGTIRDSEDGRAQSPRPDGPGEAGWRPNVYIGFPGVSPGVPLGYEDSTPAPGPNPPRGGRGSEQTTRDTQE